MADKKTSDRLRAIADAMDAGTFTETDRVEMSEVSRTMQNLAETKVETNRRPTLLRSAFDNLSLAARSEYIATGGTICD